MKKVPPLLLLMLFVLSLTTFGQTLNDSLFAFQVKKVINFDARYKYTFNKRVYNLNQDSLKLYALSAKNPSLKSLNPGFHNSDYTEKVTPNHGWHLAKLVKYSEDEEVHPHEYTNGIGNYKECLENQYGGNVEKQKKGSIYIVTRMYWMNMYLLFHPNILPTKIFLASISCNGWEAFPVLTLYAKPRSTIKLIPDSLLSSYEYDSDISVIEALVNDSSLKEPQEVSLIKDSVVAKITEEIPPTFVLDSTADVTAYAGDTIIIKDFVDEDGDRISVLYDGNIVQENIEIEHKPYFVPVRCKARVVEILVEDEGSVHPCTVRILVNKKVYEFFRKKGESIKIVRIPSKEAKT